MKNEVWQNMKTGKVIFVYEKVENHFIRAQENFKSDMALQGDFQMEWKQFIKEFVYIGKLDR